MATRRPATAPVTVRRRTSEKAAAQERVVAALRATGDLHAADRLQRCMEAMTTRRGGAGWPWACRTGGCAWCGATIKRRWWAGMRRWIAEDGATVSLAVLPLRHCPGELRAAVVRLRRALRDVRDRTARRRSSWGGVAFAGMATGTDAFVLVSHPDLARSEVARVLRKRWPTAVLQDVGAAEPSWSMSVEDAAELARVRRGVEPLRTVVLPQRAAAAAAADAEGVGHSASAGSAAAWLEPMPIAF